MHTSPQCHHGAGPRCGMVFYGGHLAPPTPEGERPAQYRLNLGAEKRDPGGRAYVKEHEPLEPKTA